MRRVMTTLLLTALVGQITFATLSVTRPAAAQDDTHWITHIVQPEENLFRIALHYNLAVEVVMAANGLTDANLVIAGQQLVIPLDAAAASTSAPVTPIQTTVLGNTVMHTVAAGDTLTQLAARYDVTVAALRSANALTLADVLVPGQILVIPLVSSADLGLIGVAPALAAINASPQAVPGAESGFTQPDLGLIGVAVPLTGDTFVDSDEPVSFVTAPDAAPATIPVLDLGILPVASGALTTADILAVATVYDTAFTPLAQPDLGILAPEAAWLAQAGVFTLGDGDLRAIYIRGLAQGNSPHAFSKVGDCNSEPPFFLAKFDRGEYDLGPYSRYQPVIDHFAGSFERVSMAAWTGNHVWAVFDPAWANPAYCLAGETPLECEFRLQKPSVVLIRLGTNEANSPQLFEENLRRVIVFALERGTIPILGTKADQLDGDETINTIIRDLADEYHVPLWDFSAAAGYIPARGLSADGFHLTYFAPDYTQPFTLQSGHGLQNLTALMVLDAVWQQAMY